MATWHLQELENRLQQIGWHVIDVEEEEYYKSIFKKSWIIKRKSIRHIDFESIRYGLHFLPYDVALEDAAGCEVRDTEITLSFGQRDKGWKDDLKDFISKLNDLD